MSENLQCYRCGASLDALSLPLSRQDQCPQCAHYLHVCKMCRHFDPAVARQCREDDAEEVMKKDTSNFCDWFVPAAGRYAGDAAEASKAQQQLDALFGGDDQPAQADGGLNAAEDLFRK